MRDRTWISFDWALKRLLRDKANLDVLEGFISTLLKLDVPKVVLKVVLRSVSAMRAAC